MTSAGHITSRVQPVTEEDTYLLSCFPSSALGRRETGDYILITVLQQPSSEPRREGGRMENGRAQA